METASVKEAVLFHSTHLLSGSNRCWALRQDVEEIGEVFDQWRTSDPKKKTSVTPSIQIPSRNRSTSLPRYEAETTEIVSSPTRKLDDASGLPPRRPLRKNGYTDVDTIGNHDNDATTPTFQRKDIRNGVILGTSSISDVIRDSGTRSLPCRTADKIEKHNGNLIVKGKSISNNKKHDFNGEHSLNSWSEGLLAEFNSIIANELSQLQSTGSHIFEENEKTANKDKIKVYDDPLINGCLNSPKDAKLRLGISRSLSWDSHKAVSDNNRSAITPTSPLTSPVMSDTVVRNRTLSLSRILRKNMFGGVAKDIPGRGDAILVRVASLPDTDTLHKTASDSDIVKRQRKTRQVQCNVFKCESTGALASEKLCTKSLGMDLPVSPNRKPKPPPKEFKGVSMYKDVLRKKVTSSEHFQNGGSSKRNGRATVDSGWPDFGEDDSDTVEEIKYVPKLRSRSASDGIPERFPVAKDSQASSENEFPEEEEVLKRTGSGMLPVALQSFLTKLRPKRSRGGARCSSPPSCCLLPDRPPVDMGTQTSPALSRSSSFTWVSDCSSSLLLHTTGSVSDTMDDDNRSTTSSADDSPDSAPVHRPGEGVFPCQCDCTSSRDSLSDSPLESLESPDREEPESGIGTASPPRNKSAVSSGGPNKPKRKETWERLRRRPSSGRPPTGYHRAGTGIKSQEVWIRQENVETQTTKSNQDEGGGKSSEDLNLIDTSSGVDGATTPEMLEEEPEVRDSGSLPLPGGKGRPIAVRPHCLPVRPQHLRSSSSPVVNRRFLSPGERHDDKMNATATSLKKATTTLVVDLGNKSSSAPLLIKKRASPGGDIGKAEDTAKKRVSGILLYIPLL
uniref:Uncharacterized protein n=1 Tax=Timema shepardi TaxID=629360 RepID=A0A7R9B4R0_TIMSH|nr:unnamed protein product [Timema shepardi]